MLELAVLELAVLELIGFSESSGATSLALIVKVRSQVEAMIPWLSI